MSHAVTTDKEFIEVWQRLKSAKKVSQELGVDPRNVHRRRKRLEELHGVSLETSKQGPLIKTPDNPARKMLGIENGTVIVFSDAHFWPGIRSTAFQGLLWAIKEFKPRAVINNGDAFDGASISRFPRIGWDSKPSLISELKACEASLEEIETAAKTNNSQ